MNGWENRYTWMSKQVNKWTNEPINKRMNGLAMKKLERTNEWIHKRMKEWKNGWLNG